MRKFHPIVAIIISYLITSLLALILPNIPISDILSLLILIIGGFIATYLSKTNKSILGFYMSVLYFVMFLPLIILSNQFTSPYTILGLFLFPAMGLIGGYMAKTLRFHLEKK